VTPHVARPCIACGAYGHDLGCPVVMVASPLCPECGAIKDDPDGFCPEEREAMRAAGCYSMPVADALADAETLRLYAREHRQDDIATFLLSSRLLRAQVVCPDEPEPCLEECVWEGSRAAFRAVPGLR
jgi:hypothetical protein